MGWRKSDRPLKLRDKRREGAVDVVGRTCIAKVAFGSLCSRSRNASTSLDLPIPGSPEMRATCPPSFACRQRDDRLAINGACTGRHDQTAIRGACKYCDCAFDVSGFSNRKRASLNAERVRHRLYG
jgi:hypothetical protein